MAKRPKGKKYRNLSKSADGIWRFQITTGGERTRVSLGTRDLEQAVRDRDEILSGTGNIIKPQRGGSTRFAEMAERYLEYDPRSKSLASTTRHDRELVLRPGSRILRFFGYYSLEEITPE